MNDITARMATMKAAALKAKSEANEWGYDTDAFHDEATPDAVIELVEALEKALHDAAVDWEAAASMNVENQDLKQRIADLENAAAEPVALRWRWNDNEAQWTYVPASRMPEFVAAGFTLENGVVVESLYTVSPALESRTVTMAAVDVLAERQRQQSSLGYSIEQDDTYTCFELSAAAICYIEPQEAENYYPADWHDDSFKPSDCRRNLVKAGALILAEIERIDRADGIQVTGD